CVGERSRSGKDATVDSQGGPHIVSTAHHNINAPTLSDHADRRSLSLSVRVIEVRPCVSFRVAEIAASGNPWVSQVTAAGGRAELVLRTTRSRDPLIGPHRQWRLHAHHSHRGWNDLHRRRRTSNAARALFAREAGQGRYGRRVWHQQLRRLHRPYGWSEREGVLGARGAGRR